MAFAALLATMDRAVLSHLGGGTVSYSWSGLLADFVDVVGVFEAAHQIALSEPGVTTVSPALFVRVADLPGAPGDDVDARVRANGTEYRVRTVQPDGQGGALLLLTEA